MTLAAHQAPTRDTGSISWAAPNSLQDVWKRASVAVVVKIVGGNARVDRIPPADSAMVTTVHRVQVEDVLKDDTGQVAARGFLNVRQHAGAAESSGKKYRVSEDSVFKPGSRWLLLLVRQATDEYDLAWGPFSAFEVGPNSVVRSWRKEANGKTISELVTQLSGR